MDSLTTVGRQVQRLHASSGHLGKTLFKETRDKLASTAFATSIVDELEVVKHNMFSQESIATMVANTSTKGSTFEKQRVTAKRDIHINMKTLKAIVEVTSTSFERDVRLGVALREECLGKMNGIPMLPNEVALHPELVDNVDPIDVPRHLISGIIDFREMFLADIQTKKANTLEKQIDLLKAKWDTYMQCGRCIVIERALMMTSQGSVDTRVTSDVLGLLPDTSTTFKLSPDGCLTRLVELMATSVFALTSDDVRQQVDLVAEGLKSMKLGCPPSPDLLKGSVFTKTAYQRFHHFVKYEVPAKDDEPPTKLSGKAALDHMFVDMTERMLDISCISAPKVDDLQVFTDYDFMLDRSNKKTVETWLSNLIAKASGASALALVPVVSAASGASSSSSAPPASIADTKKTQSKSALLKFFRPRAGKLKTDLDAVRCLSGVARIARNTWDTFCLLM